MHFSFTSVHAARPAEQWLQAMQFSLGNKMAGLELVCTVYISAPVKFAR